MPAAVIKVSLFTVAMLLVLGVVSIAAAELAEGTTASPEVIDAVVSVARSEHGQYGGLHECSDTNMQRRVGDYWDGLGLAIDGCDRDVPWSAAFVSFVVREAGAGAQFQYSSAHRTYIHDAFAGDGLYPTVADPQQRAPRLGDLVCNGRGAIADWDYEDFLAWFGAGGRTHESIPTHCDIVVERSGSGFEVVGGNVDQTVTRSSASAPDYALVLASTSESGPPGTCPRFAVCLYNGPEADTASATFLKKDWTYSNNQYEDCDTECSVDNTASVIVNGRRYMASIHFLDRGMTGPCLRVAPGQTVNLVGTPWDNELTGHTWVSRTAVDHGCDADPGTATNYNRCDRGTMCLYRSSDFSGAIARFDRQDANYSNNEFAQCTSNCIVDNNTSVVVNSHPTRNSIHFLDLRRSGPCLYVPAGSAVQLGSSSWNRQLSSFQWVTGEAADYDCQEDSGGLTVEELNAMVRCFATREEAEAPNNAQEVFRVHGFMPSEDVIAEWEPAWPGDRGSATSRADASGSRLIRWECADDERNYPGKRTSPRDEDIRLTGLVSGNTITVTVHQLPPQ